MISSRHETADDAPDEQQHHIVQRRKCTDVGLVIIFLLFLGGWGFIVWEVWSSNAGDLLLPKDYNGDTCGGSKHPSSDIVYIPDKTQVLLKMCVSTCPAIGSTVCRKEFSGLTSEELRAIPTGGCINLRVGGVLEYRCGDNQTLGEILSQSGDCFISDYSSSDVLYRCTPTGVNVAITNLESETIETEQFFGGIVLTGLTEISAARYTVAAAVGCSFLLSVLFSIGFQVNAFVTFTIAITGNLLVLAGSAYRSYVYYDDADDDLTPISSAVRTIVMVFGFVCVGGLVAYLFLMVIVLRKAATATVTEVAEVSAKCFTSSLIPATTSLCSCITILLVIGIAAFMMLLIGSHGDKVILTHTAVMNSSTDPVYSNGVIPTYTPGLYNITTSEFSYTSQLWQLYNFMGALWVINFVWCSTCLAMSVQVSSWYYSEDILSSDTKRIKTKGGGAFISHLGSLLLGSACSTLFGWFNDLISSCKGSKMLPIDSANYVIIAVSGVSYFEAGCMAKRLSYSHKALLGPIIFATETCYSLVRFFIPSVSTLSCWVLLREFNFPVKTDTKIRYAVFPLIAMWVGSFFIASLLIGTISTFSKSLIFLYFKDSDSDVSQHFAPQSLADIISRQLEAEKLRIALEDTERSKRYSTVDQDAEFYKTDREDIGARTSTSGSHPSAARVAWGEVSTGERTATDVDLEIIDTTQ